MEYARHFHFFDEPSATDDATPRKESASSGWLYNVDEFSVLPGRGVHCSIHGKQVLVTSLLHY